MRGLTADGSHAAPGSRIPIPAASVTLNLQVAATRAAHGWPWGVLFINLGVGVSAGPARANANGDRDLRIAGRREGNAVKVSPSSNELKG